MDGSQNILKKRNGRMVSWVKDPYNLAFIGILICALLIRIYYFTLTHAQPVWWDEAEYLLKAKSIAFGTSSDGWLIERELLIPLLFAALLKMGGTEVTLRVVQVLVSTITVGMTYITISKIINKKVGLFATFGMAFFWLHIFFTERILVYLWDPLFYLLILYFFYTGYVQGNKKHLITFAVISGIGLQIRFSIGFALFGLFLFLIFSEGKSLLKNRAAWTALIIFLIVTAPSMIYFWNLTGSPLPRYTGGLGAAINEQGAGFGGMFSYIKMFPSRVGWSYTILSFTGILFFTINLLVGWGVKGHFRRNREWFLLFFVGFFVPLSLFTTYAVAGGSAVFYDGWIMSIFPFAFAFAGLSLSKIYKFLRRYHKFIGVGAVAIFLLLHANFGLRNADISIKNKISSYDSVKYAGEWINENSNPHDSVVSKSVPQNVYYSERITYGYPKTPEEFESLLNEKRPLFVIDSIWESTEQWIHSYPMEHPDRFRIVNAWFLDPEQTQPSLIVYEVIYRSTSLS